jgi:hypothetical protein
MLDARAKNKRCVGHGRELASRPSVAFMLQKLSIDPSQKVFAIYPFSCP